MAECTNLQPNDAGEYDDVISFQPIPPERKITIERGDHRYCYDALYLQRYFDTQYDVALVLPDTQVPVTPEELALVRRLAGNGEPVAVQLPVRQAANGFVQKGYYVQNLGGLGIRCRELNEAGGPGLFIPCPEGGQLAGERKYGFLNNGHLVRDIPGLGIRCNELTNNGRPGNFIVCPAESRAEALRRFGNRN